MGKDNEEFLDKAKDSLEQLAGKTKEIFSDVKDRYETRMDEDSGKKRDRDNWSGQDHKHAAGEYEYQTRNQYQNGVRLDAVPDSGGRTAGGREDTSERASRYEEQQPVSDFAGMGTAGGETAVEDTAEGSRADYGTEAVYGDPTGRYDGNEANMLSDDERRTRYDEQEPVDNFLDEIEGPEQPRL